MELKCYFSVCRRQIICFIFKFLDTKKLCLTKFLSYLEFSVSQGEAACQHSDKHSVFTPWPLICQSTRHIIFSGYNPQNRVLSPHNSDFTPAPLSGRDVRQQRLQTRCFFFRAAYESMRWKAPLAQLQLGVFPSASRRCAVVVSGGWTFLLQCQYLIIYQLTRNSQIHQPTSSPTQLPLIYSSISYSSGLTIMNTSLQSVYTIAHIFIILKD